MTLFHVIVRNLFHFRAASLALAVGMAVATAVLTGALMVGDSVRASLQDLAVRRLGQVDYALAATRFFDDSPDDSLARRMAAAAGIGGKYQLAPAVIVSGGASVGEGEQRRRSGDVQIAATADDWVKVSPGQSLFNRELADALGISPVSGAGPAVVFSFPSQEEGPRDATIARRDPTEAIAGLRAETSQVLPDDSMPALFNLAGGQRISRNAWTNLRELQEQVNQPGRANVLLVHDRASSDPHTASTDAGATTLNAALKSAVQLKDYGLEVRPAGKSGEAALWSHGTYLDGPTIAAANRVAQEMGVKPRLVTINLVNAAVRLGSDGKPLSALHYVIGAGISDLEDGPLAEDEIAFNQATAEQLGVKAGDRIRLDYFRRQDNGELAEVKSSDAGLIFHVAKILPTSGLGADRTLTPAYKGLTDAVSVSDWKPPRELHIDAKLAEKDNDAYWRKYKAAPRLFISIGAARKLWGGAFGDLTSIRIPAARADEFARMLRDTLDPASMGLAFRPVKAEQIAAASGGGSNEFSMIFVSLSFFLIAAAVLLVAMLFRLNVEQRARQIGLLAAVGFAPKHLRRVSLLEGMILAIIGGLLGLPAAAGYTWLIIYGLRTWWVGAVGTTALRLHVDPVTLAEGFVSGLVVAFFAVLWGVWRVGRTPAAQLLAGSFASVVRTKLRAARITLGAGILLSLGGLGVLAMSLGKSTPPEAALAGGAMLLAAFICLSAATLRPRHHAGAVMSSVTRLGIRNASRHTARSVLSAGLIAFATFTLIIVASMRQRAPEDTGNPGSGAGGYRLMVRAGIPLLGDLSTPRGREMLGVTDRDNPLWSSARFMSMRRWAGQDVSCLNLCRPGSPTILAVPHEMVQRGGFSFAPEEKEKNQWALLESPQANDDIPVIADSETAQYILHLPLGGVLPFTDQSGASRKLKLVATLSGSIFQSELLMGEASFRRLFPSQSGFGVVLVETPADQMRSVEQLLNRELEEYAVSVDTTAARLAMYQEVANTYLSTFQTLGALGLMLGTIGLSVVLVRNVIERRPELALLGAIGFPVRDRIVLILSENAFILALGLIAGTICALLGIAPTLLRTHGSVAIGSLAITLAAVLVVGLLASIAAVFIAGLRASPAALRSE